MNTLAHLWNTPLNTHTPNFGRLDELSRQVIDLDRKDIFDV